MSKAFSSRSLNCAQGFLVLFLTQLFFISAVGAIDLYFLVKYAEVLIEENPLGQFFIDIGGVPLFAAVKMFGTVLAIQLFTWLYVLPKTRKYALIAGHVIFLFTVFFFWYLCFG